MKTLTRLAGAAGVALAATGLFATTAFAASASAAPAAPTRHPGPPPGAVFVQTDNPAGNAVVAYARAANGTLHLAGTYPTGGIGGQLTGSVVDHLASEGSVALSPDGDLLYTVNAGSDTATVFAVAGDHLARLQVVGSGGTFPVSIAVQGDLVYVVDARDGGAVQGYVQTRFGLEAVPQWHRSLGLDATATPEFTNTPGQIAFTPDGRQLVVTTKANGNDIDVFALDRFGGPIGGPVVNAEGSTVPFGITFDARGHLVVADAGNNAVATYTVTPSGNLRPVDSALTGQAATCWVAGDGTYFYASNAGSADVAAYRDGGSGRLTSIGTTTTDAGTVDAVTAPGGRDLYVETGGAGIVDEFAIAPNGALTAIGSVTVANAVGAEGIAAS